MFFSAIVISGFFVFKYFKDFFTNNFPIPLYLYEGITYKVHNFFSVFVFFRIAIPNIFSFWEI